MTNMWKNRAKLCVKSWLNFVYIFVNFLNSFKLSNFSTSLFPHFHHMFHPLLNSFSSPILIKAFPLFHKPYYYYNDLLNNNYINRKD